MTPSFYRAASACLLFLGLVAPAVGQPERNPRSPWYLADSDRRWHFEAFLGIESEPDYPGSDDNEAEPDGDFRAGLRTGAGHRYFFSLGQATAYFDLSDRWLLQAKLEYEEGREVENGALRGFDEGDDTLEGEFALFRRFGDAYLAGVVQPDLLGRGKGLVTFVGFAYDRGIGERQVLSPRIDVSWGDAEHMMTEFGITADQSAASGLPAYRAGAGLKSSTAGLSWRLAFGRRWSLLGDLELEYYFANAADSPLLAAEGSDLTYEASVGVLFSF